MGRTEVGEKALDFLRRTFRGRFRITPIAGDASTKRFYRVRAGRRTAVLMVNPDPLDPSSPLISNHRILETIGAPVPRFMSRDDEAGLVLTQDFGDATLQRYLTQSRNGGRARARPRPPGTWLRLYRQACDLIVLLQSRASEAIRPDDFAARNALDRDRFLFELDHFHRHFLLGLLGLRPGPADEALLRSFYSDLAQECDRMPRVYCHRDFMSRNLMLDGGRLRLIDYQDARMGPYTYDAASLLRDSSLDIDEGLASGMIDYLAARLGEGPEEFRGDFKTMALQRNIKELGTFGYMARERGLASYLAYIPRAIRSIRRTLLREQRFHFIYPVLDRHVLSPAARMAPAAE